MVAYVSDRPLPTGPEELSGQCFWPSIAISGMGGGIVSYVPKAAAGVTIITFVFQAEGRKGRTKVLSR